MIPAGTKYLRHVVRLGSRKFCDRLQNLHHHLDCDAPWYQPDNQTNRLRNLARLVPPVPDYAYLVAQPVRQIPLVVDSAKLGSLTWEPPVTLARSLALAATGASARAEIENVLGIVLTAFLKASENKRRAMRINNLITQLASEIT